MDKYRNERKSLLRARYTADLPRINKLPGFYQRNSSQVQSPNTSVHMLALPTPTTLSLKCPISFNRQTFPVRTVDCQHLETFDLLAFIDTISFSDLLLRGFLRVLSRSDPVQPHTVIHTCPICSVKSPLYIDSTILEVLTRHPKFLTVMVTPTGQLVPYTSTSPLHPVVDLVSPLPIQDADVFISPLPVTPHPTGLPATVAPKRRFSFSDLGAGCRRSSSSYQRLSTVDLTVGSPC